jgi:hypothetical protein
MSHLNLDPPQDMPTALSQRGIGIATVLVTAFNAM